MVHAIWIALFAIGLITAMVNGRLEEVSEAIFKGAEEAVVLCFGLISVMVFWLGMMNIARKSGLLDMFVKLFRPIVLKLFPDIPASHPALGYILSNITANMMGLGNAATPMGIKAMKELKKLHGGKDEASRSMVTLMALNTAGLTLIPTTVIAIRMNYDSAQPTEIVGTTLFATACSTLAAILIDRYFYYRKIKRNGSR
ncbi:nucleoside recognition domain-containing protein [Aliibacillus thermotolerans]|uniref:Nucleoside recognition domain-containing protein n=1 Tax=Aliibacillus thermotolerans TaxID=1834418 RepID=A0ABW0U890_9BACI|nr:nucleoside recognition domain-containing protein [Aliibacillus thermotolerans]MDA3128649.1 spore maturation protein [Aliibacillus thermotolerans]